MAQPFFAEHPVGDYLRDAGENQFSIPGISSDFERELEPNFDCSDDDDNDEPLPEWRPQLLVEFLQLLQSIISVANSNSAPSPFVERFRYNVISSSLLSPSLSAHPSPRQSKPFRIPGKLHHSRTSSVEDANPPLAPIRATQSPDSTVGVVSLTATAAAVFLSIGYPVLSLLSLFPTFFLMFNPFGTSDTPKHDMSLTFNGLEDLLSANDSWESTVQDTINVLDVEERSLHTTTVSSVSSPIRVALHSCLQSTHTQCDNIRHLFSALTSPTELPQLAEMYAPPSPIKTAFATEMASRPFSYPSAHLSPPSVNDTSPSTPSKKRFTWSGSYLSLADAGSPTNMINRRRERRSAQLRDVFEVGNENAVLVSPFPGTEGGPEVAEGETTKAEVPNSISSQFGAAALDLQRKRKSVGLGALRSPPIMTAPELRTSRGLRNSLLFSPNAPSSKFTSPLPSRHPLSFTALTFSLQGAMAAKRYACAHLLALRFSDDEDDGYWEDVRSVIGLLTSTLVDASSRLSEALDENEQQKIAEGKPTPDRTRSGAELEEVEQDDSFSTSASLLQDIQTVGSGFAPMPSHISRFAAHIAAITSAMDDARDHLEQCVSTLKAEHAKPSFMSASQRRLGHIRSLSRPYYASNGEESKEAEEEEEPKALQSYERLRRELGLALRECERGRDRLLEIVYSPLPILSDDEEEEDLPALGHDASDESDKFDPISPRSEAEETEVRPVAQIINTTGGGVDGVDDVTAHLLLTSTTHHLPLPGIEEVFEAETGPIIPFLRERPKLSREERIRLARSRRESGGSGNRHGLGLSGVEEPRGGKIERWGPGGDVVQELKDVIWKVGERKRKMSQVAEATEREQDPFLDPKES